MILLSQPPKYWDYKRVPPRPAEHLNFYLLGSCAETPLRTWEMGTTAVSAGGGCARRWGPRPAEPEGSPRHCPQRLQLPTKRARLCGGAGQPGRYAGKMEEEMGRHTYVGIRTNWGKLIWPVSLVRPV